MQVLHGFVREFRDAPCRSEKARPFVVHHIPRWFTIASDGGIAGGGQLGDTFVRSRGGGFTTARAVSLVISP